MNRYLLLIFCFFSLLVKAQTKSTKIRNDQYGRAGKYFSFNPLGLVEPHISIGAGFGNRYSLRSEYFTELSYIANAPFYDNETEQLNGFRLLAQYRYHFLQRWKPILDLGFNSKERRARHAPFIAIEFRMKNYSFSDKNTFVNYKIFDTLNNINYSANALSLGGALIFGGTFSISRNGKWKLECTAGIGGKQKLIRFKNLPKDYEVIRQRKPDVLRAPYIYEGVGSVCIPATIRFRYYIN